MARPPPASHPRHHLCGGDRHRRCIVDAGPTATGSRPGCLVPTKAPPLPAHPAESRASAPHATDLPYEAGQATRRCRSKGNTGQMAMLVKGGNGQMAILVKRRYWSKGGNGQMPMLVNRRCWSKGDAGQKAVLSKGGICQKAILVKRRYWSKGDTGQKAMLVKRRCWSKGGTGQKAMLVKGGTGQKAVARRAGAVIMRRMSGSCRDKEKIRVQVKIKALSRV